MNNKFDELAKGLAQSVTRRAALRRCGLGLGGVLLGSSSLARRALANPVSGPSAIITHNFTGSTSADCPNGAFCDKPDATGAVGPVHFVELVNNHYAVYRKGDGVRVQSLSGDGFWTLAGITFANKEHALDPQMLYDPASRRWFGSAINVFNNDGINADQGRDLLFAVSKSSDPTEGWTGFRIHLLANHESPSLGFNRDGCTFE